MQIKKLLPSLAAFICSMVIVWGVSTLLGPVKDKKEAEEQQKVMELLLPGSTTFTPEAYDGEDANIKEVFRGETGCVVRTNVAGYAEDIVMLIGVDNEGKVTGVVVEDMNETRGLGRRAVTDMEFLSQYLDTAGEAEVGGNVDALSGATVTTKAVTKAVNSAAAYMTGADVSSSATEWEE